MCIDVDAAELLEFGIFIGERVEVDYHKADRQAYLGRCETDAFGIPHCFEHVLYEFLKIGIVGVNVCRCLSEYGLAVEVNR